jgi:molybdopterin/thiamine biosynthesis adenylyltransferase
METPGCNPVEKLRSITVVGAGNIGSHLLPLLGRMLVGCSATVNIVDHGSYDEARNLIAQAITPSDLGQPKADVATRRLREINPVLHVNSIVERVENVPMGLLRADVIIGCLDSRRARRDVSRIASRLGVPFVDAGVQADGLLARIHVFMPGEDCPCVECAWDEASRLTEEASFSCDGSEVQPAPTNAPARLGALAAAMLALEVGKIISGDWEHVASNREVLIDAKSHRHFVSRLVRNPACRWDHRTFQLREFRGAPSMLTLENLFGMGISDLHVENQSFSCQWICPSCKSGCEVFGLGNRILVPCPCCYAEMRPIGFYSLEKVNVADIPDNFTTVPLARLGIRAGDIFSGTMNGEEVHFELVDQPICQP